MTSGMGLGSLACGFLFLFSFIPWAVAAPGEIWWGSLSVYGSRVSSVTGMVHKNFTLNGAMMGSESLAASAPANVTAHSSATTAFSGYSNGSSLNLTFSWNIDPSLFRAGYWEGVCATAQSSPSGAVFIVVCSISFILGGSGTSWESNLTVYPFFTMTQGIVNYTWASGRMRMGTVGLSALAAPSGPTNVTKDTTLSMLPNNTSVSLTLRLNYIQPQIPTTFWGRGSEGNGGSNPGTLLINLTERGTFQPTTASSVFPPIILWFFLTVIIGIPVILGYRRRS